MRKYLEGRETIVQDCLISRRDGRAWIEKKTLYQSKTQPLVWYGIDEQFPEKILVFLEVGKTGLYKTVGNIKPENIDVIIPDKFKFIPSIEWMRDRFATMAEKGENPPLQEIIIYNYLMHQKPKAENE